jgi:hypothetical protein
MRPEATSVCGSLVKRYAKSAPQSAARSVSIGGLELLVYESLELLVFEALSY